MTHNKSLSRRDLKRDMNLALDGMLDDEASIQLAKRLAESPKEVLWDRMQKVDRLLASEPGLQAPPDFAMKVMSAISAGKMPLPAHNRTDLRAVIGMLLAVALLLPVVLITLLFMRQLLTDPVALNTLIAQVSVVFNTGIQAITSVFRGIANNITGDTLLVVSLITSLTLSLLTWSGMVRFFTAKRQQVVYRIPVQAA